MPTRRLLLLGCSLALLLAARVAPAQSEDELLRGLNTTAEVSWRAAAFANDPAYLRILAINDLHGALLPQEVEFADGRQRRVGGAAVLASFINAERAAYPKQSLLLIAGDSIGASPGISGLLRDEPTMAVLNQLAEGECPLLSRDWSTRPAPVVSTCHVLATVGNHEFDNGSAELERLLYGGRHPGGPLLGSDWKGTRIPFLAANVRRRDGHQPFLPASAIVVLDGAKIGIIGAVTADTPGMEIGSKIADLEFLPEAAAINAEVARLHALKVRTIVLLIHEGLTAPVKPQRLAPVSIEDLSGGLARVLRGLTGGIDIVIAGHTHKLNNVLVPLADHHLALVVQAESRGQAFSSIDVTIDKSTDTVVEMSARVRIPWADGGPGTTPDKHVAKIVAAASKAVQPIVARPIGTAVTAMALPTAPCAESALADLVADAERSAAATDMAFMNIGGIRAPIAAGAVTFGTIYSVHPFGNQIVRLALSGAQVLKLLEEQWYGEHEAQPLCLAASGLRYVYDLRRAPGHRVLAAWDADNHPLDPAAHYRIASNDYLAGGGDHFPELENPPDVEVVTGIREALEAWFKRAPDGVGASVDGRMERVDVPAP